MWLRLAIHRKFQTVGQNLYLLILTVIETCAIPIQSHTNTKQNIDFVALSSRAKRMMVKIPSRVNQPTRKQKRGENGKEGKLAGKMVLTKDTASIVWVLCC